MTIDRNKGRGTGRTTQQMLSAAQGAIYVWPARGSIRYAKDLARHLGREDLRIKTVQELTDYWKFQGRTFTGIVIDHAAELGPISKRGYEIILSGIR